MIIYSSILDKLIHEIGKIHIDTKKRKVFTNNIIQYFKLDRNMLKRIETITKTSVPNVPIYFIPSWPSKLSAISNPIIITVDRPIEEIQNLVIHELIHATLRTVQTKPLHTNESKLTQNHILVHAILKEVLSTEAYELDKRMCKDWDDYRRAWEIVDDEGSKEIIRKYLGKALPRVHPTHGKK